MFSRSKRRTIEQPVAADRRNDVVDVGGKRDEKRARTSLAGHLSPIKDGEERGARNWCIWQLITIR